LRTAALRLRALACVGTALATLLTVAPATFAAETSNPELTAATLASVDLAAPVTDRTSAAFPGLAFSGLPGSSPRVDLIAPSSIAPSSILPGSRITPGAATAVRDVLTPPALLLHEAISLAAAPLALSSQSPAARVISAAKSHLGARYVHGATGPRTFDCIGLVLRSFSQAGLMSRVGGWANGSGYALYSWARRHHLTSTTHGQPGDVVIWGGGGHVGIYLGNGMAISALVSGVRIHGIYAVTKRFTTFVHTGLAGVGVAPPAPSVKTKSIGVRHATTTQPLRTGHSTTDTKVSTLKPGTKLTLLRIWKGPNGRTWYRVNANTHVGWVLGSLTRP
jgi:cell wall-associated NlpC family hydrolase